MFKNVTDAFREELRRLVQEGEAFAIADKEVQELRSQAIAIAFPLERVAILSHKSNHIFAQIAATVAIIGGHETRHLLSHYLPNWIGGDREILRHQPGGNILKEVAEILRQPHASDAVLTISDSIISSESELPTSLHFTLRQGILHLNVFIPGNARWRNFIEIETFQWSAIQEILAYWTGSKIGNIFYFIGSLQLERDDIDNAQEMLKNGKTKTLYDFGFQSPKFSTKLTDFEAAIAEWFAIEEKMRQGEMGVNSDRITDEFLKNSLNLLYLYHRDARGATATEIGQLLEALPENDLKLAAIAYFCDKFQRRDFLSFSEKEREYFDYLWGKPEPAAAYSFSEIFELLSILHYKKTLVYKNSWKKHGEALGVFAGISRKYDRLETMFTENVKPTADESILDTFADLAVYCTKYLTYLAEHYPPIFKTFIQQYPPVEKLETYWYNEGFDPVSEILIRQYEKSEKWQQIGSYQECFEAIRERYKELEDIFVKEDWRVSDPRKCSLSADLAIVAVHYLVLASQQEPETVQKFATAIENL